MLRSKKLQRKKETVVKTPTGLILTMKCKKLQVSAAEKFDKHGGFYFSFSQMAFCRLCFRYVLHRLCLWRNQVLRKKGMVCLFKISIFAFCDAGDVTLQLDLDARR